MKRVAIIPGSFRPPTDGHFKMIRHYAGSCDAVAVIISNPEKDLRETSTGVPISPETSKRIIETALGDAEIGNVRVFIAEGSPVKEIWNILGNLGDREVVLGMGTKDDADGRFGRIVDEFQGKRGLKIVPPSETAFDSGDDYSASDLRERIGDEEYLRGHLPQCLSPENMEEAVKSLQDECGVGNLREGRTALGIFERVLSESCVYGAGPSGLFEDDETLVGVDMSDSALGKAKCRVGAWNMHVQGECVSECGFDRESSPDKAVDVTFEFPDGTFAEVFLDPEFGEWDSIARSGDVEARLSPDQMATFFGTDFYKRLYNRLNGIWPCDDPEYSDLIHAINEKKLKLDRAVMDTVEEDGPDNGKKWYDGENSRKKNVAGRQVTTRSGRKLVTFSDFGVKHDDNEAYFVWPEIDKEFKWSQWQDWEKISPLMRMRFRHQGHGDYVYGLSLSPFAQNDENRGFRAYNLTLEPKLQYLTPEETQQMMDLSIVQKFLRNALKRLSYFMSIPDEKLVKLIDAPDRVQEDEIRKTKRVIKNTMKAIRDRRADTYIYT